MRLLVAQYFQWGDILVWDNLLPDPDSVPSESSMFTSQCFILNHFNTHTDWNTNTRRTFGQMLSDVTRQSADDGMNAQMQKASTLTKVSNNSLEQNQSTSLNVVMKISISDRPGNWLPVRGWPCSAGCRCSRRAEWGTVQRIVQGCWNTEKASCRAAEELWACTRTGSSSASTKKNTAIICNKKKAKLKFTFG